MQKITQISGKVMPLAMNDVDTDLIIPAQYLTSISQAGYGKNLFIRLRQNDPNFVFNQEKFMGANILVTQENFGCGSSREHAVWALQEAGIQAVIAISFGDIFFSNSGKNGLVLIELPATVIKQVLIKAALGGYQMVIDVEKQRVTSNKQETFEFTMDPFRKHCFVNGLGDLDYLLSKQQEIAAYRATRSH